MKKEILQKNKLYIILVISALVLSSLLLEPSLKSAPLAQAQSTSNFFDVFLELDSVQGTSSNHQGAIDVLSWSWGANNTAIGLQSSGAGAGKVNMQDFSFTKRIDKSSPQLYSLSVSGKRAGDAVLEVNNGNGTYTQLTLTNVKVGSYGLSSSGGDKPTESVTLNFSKIKVEYDVVPAKK